MNRVSKFLMYVYFSVMVPISLFGCMSEDASVNTTSVRAVGLEGVQQTSSVPPSGEGVAPLIGYGGDGAAVVTGVGGWSTGPGAVKWHGGQWIIPYGAAPGSVVTNMFCDVVPRADATDTMELVGANGVIGTATVPATTNNVIIRAWILPANNGYVIHDGEQLVMRHSPRDSTTGAWTSAAQDLTIVGCAVRTVAATTTLVIPAQMAVPTFGVMTLGTGNGSWGFPLSGTGQVVYPIMLPVGKTLLSWSVGGYKQSDASVTMFAFLVDGTGNGIARSNTTLSQQFHSENAPGSIAFGGTVTIPVAAGHSYVVLVEKDGAGNFDESNDLTITYF